MIRFLPADNNSKIRNINFAPDASSPYAKVVNWMGANADGYILLFTDAVDTAAVERYFNSLDKSVSDPKMLTFTDENTKVRVLSNAEFRGAGGKFVCKDALLVPTRVTIQTYRIVDGDINIYRTGPDEGNSVIPILINYTVSIKKSLLFMGDKRATISFSNKNCADGALFYRISGVGVKYPITRKMIENSFSVSIGKQDINVIAVGKYGQYYNVKQKRI